MKFLTTTDGAKRLIEADSAKQAAQIAERESEGAAQVICLRGGMCVNAHDDLLQALDALETVTNLLRGDGHFPATVAQLEITLAKHGRSA